MSQKQSRKVSLEESLTLLLGEEILPFQKWPDEALLIHFAFCYRIAVQWAQTFTNQSIEDLTRGPRVFLNLQRLKSRITGIYAWELKADPNLDSTPSRGFPLAVSVLFINGIEEEIQRRMKHRTVNGKWVEYLRHRKDESVVRFLDAITPRGRSSADLSKIPGEFCPALRRHVYALSWEDREDELHNAWISFAEWISRRVLTVDPRVSRDQLEAFLWGEDQTVFYEALKQDIKTMFAIYWSFRQLGKGKEDDSKGADYIPKLETRSRLRDKYRKFYPAIKEFPYLDERGKQRFLRVEEVELDVPPADHDESSEKYNKKKALRDKIREIGEKYDPANIVIDELSNKQLLADLMSRLRPEEQKFLDNLIRQSKGADRVNVSAAAKESRISRQMAHRYLRRIRELAEQFGPEGRKDVLG